MMEGHAEAIYKMLKRFDCYALVPIDNQLMVEEGRL